VNVSVPRADLASPQAGCRGAQPAATPPASAAASAAVAAS